MYVYTYARNLLISVLFIYTVFYLHSVKYMYACVSRILYIRLSTMCVCVLHGNKFILKFVLFCYTTIHEHFVFSWLQIFNLHGLSIGSYSFFLYSRFFNAINNSVRFRDVIVVRVTVI